MDLRIFSPNGISRTIRGPIINYDAVEGIKISLSRKMIETFDGYSLAVMDRNDEDSFILRLKIYR